MDMTQSERIFENFCDRLKIKFARVPRGAKKIPDYELTINRQRIIVEVKEIEKNKDETESDRLAKERGYGQVLSTMPGQRVRKKIYKSSPQIKAKTDGVYPSILALFDGAPLSDHLSNYNIRVAMYGLEEIHIAVPEDPKISSYITGKSYGSERKMTPNDNKSISAIGVLHTTSRKEIDLDLYHNKYASNPLDPKLFQNYAIAQFVLGEGVNGGTAQWERVDV